MKFALHLSHAIPPFIISYQYRTFTGKISPRTRPGLKIDLSQIRKNFEKLKMRHRRMWKKDSGARARGFMPKSARRAKICLASLRSETPVYHRAPTSESGCKLWLDSWFCRKEASHFGGRNGRDPRPSGQMATFLAWLRRSEDKFANMELVPTVGSEIQRRVAQHQRLHKLFLTTSSPKRLISPTSVKLFLTLLDWWSRRRHVSWRTVCSLQWTCTRLWWRTQSILGSFWPSSIETLYSAGRVIVCTMPFMTITEFG